MSNVNIDSKSNRNELQNNKTNLLKSVKDNGGPSSWNITSFIIGVFLMCLPLAFAMIWHLYTRVEGSLDKTTNELHVMDNKIEGQTLLIEELSKTNTLLVQILNLNNKAYRGFSQKRYPEALNAVNESIKLLPELLDNQSNEQLNKNIKSLLAENYLIGAIAMYRIDKQFHADEIILYTTKVIEYDATQHKAYAIRAFAKYELGKPLATIKSDLEHSWELNKKRSIDPLNLAEQLLVNNIFDEVEMWANNFIKSFGKEENYGTRNGLLAYQFFTHIPKYLETGQKEHLDKLSKHFKAIKQKYSDAGFWEFDILQKWINNLDQNSKLTQTQKTDVLAMYRLMQAPLDPSK